MAISTACRHGPNCPKCQGRIARSIGPVQKTPPQANVQNKSQDDAFRAIILHHLSVNDTQRSPGKSRLYTLPQEVVNMIARHLPYETLLLLHTLSKTLQRIIDPQLASEASKISLVMRAEKDGTHNFGRRPPPRQQMRDTATAATWTDMQPRLGCFCCFRVLPVGEFAAEQLARDPFRPATAPASFLRRYCVPCGLARQWHYPGEVIERRDASTCWVCQCRRAWDKSTTLSCRYCGS
ncbi:hypothetical protein PFICI_06943 [Pestalotiopsis fici W106-1]|uniref:F-box domain-containing protein n=1 Tax=Pestalotiopsis fici (strain W106-1 / CGMCC3.15140) TaxID=1229662 RepID=W3X9U2_PESFW|nr:uncharacterized protein PFICI_06943 [Pestalotiopsis fici W106-1]ETS81941.1 hypothetical protein PFICI_06943 [Pestalotiopsis fici W106-1]